MLAKNKASECGEPVATNAYTSNLNQRIIASMIVTRKSCNVAEGPLWLCIEVVEKNDIKYYNLFPLIVASTLDGKPSTIVDHQDQPHGTNHGASTDFKIVTDLTSENWTKTIIWDQSSIFHPQSLKDEGILIRINDDDITSDDDEELLKKTLRSEISIYLSNLSKIDPILAKQISNIKGIGTLIEKDTFAEGK